MGMEPQGKIQHIKAQVPMAEVFRYATDLRSMTQGRGSFSLTFSHYERCPLSLLKNNSESNQAAE